MANVLWTHSPVAVASRVQLAHALLGMVTANRLALQSPVVWRCYGTSSGMAEWRLKDQASRVVLQRPTLAVAMPLLLCFLSGRRLI